MVAGKITRDDAGLWIVASQSEQRFALEIEGAGPPPADSSAEITGDWKSAGKPPNEREVITIKQLKKSAINSAAPQRASVESVDLTSGEFPAGLGMSLA